MKARNSDRRPVVGDANSNKHLSRSERLKSIGKTGVLTTRGRCNCTIGDIRKVRGKCITANTCSPCRQMHGFGSTSTTSPTIYHTSENCDFPCPRLFINTLNNRTSSHEPCAWSSRYALLRAKLASATQAHRYQAMPPHQPFAPSFDHVLVVTDKAAPTAFRGRQQGVGIAEQGSYNADATRNMAW
ncbi:uncharacterized protein BKA78DRAFT_53177 [Phyllosticta capitalensis]|uniref:uncharacterized protein n=1 Tax=Phyllosticta capitalensis TaxID=121624 RepID=UPI00313111E5